MKINNYVEYDTRLSRFCKLSWFNWVDVETASCNFDSDSFIRFLDYVMAYTEEEKEFSEDDFDYKKEMRQYMDDKTILASLDIGNFDNYMRILKGQFNGAPVTILGNPEENGAEFYISLGGVWSFGIAESSDKKELAWDFVKYMINYDFTANNSMVWGIMMFFFSSRIGPF